MVVSACMDADEMILSGRLAVDDPLLDAQIPLAARRPVRTGWRVQVLAAGQSRPYRRGNGHDVRSARHRVHEAAQYSRLDIYVI